ncbi:MAG TPA: VTT domain-containing protein [Flavipsychrobacter sp.]|nr:VTT domain-containing protein [Flavipsychrobacter sp.]
MQDLIEFLKNLMNADWIMAHGGLYLVALIVFAETGLFVGFFLPGDSLLFVSGLIVANSTLAAPLMAGPVDLVFWMLIISICGIFGNFVGYWFGQKTGPILFERKDTWLFKRKHLIQAKEFYEKKGGGAIVLARFLPIVRTFAPIVAGIVKMNFKKFVFYNVLGSFAWVISMMLLGYLLGNNEWVKNNLEKIILLIVFVTTAPVIFKMFFSKKKDPTLEVGKDIVEETFSSHDKK